jgi:hypothetical protein
MYIAPTCQVIPIEKVFVIDRWISVCSHTKLQSVVAPCGNPVAMTDTTFDQNLVSTLEINHLEKNHKHTIFYNFFNNS